MDKVMNLTNGMSGYTALSGGAKIVRRYEGRVSPVLALRGNDIALYKRQRRLLKEGVSLAHDAAFFDPLTACAGEVKAFHSVEPVAVRESLSGFSFAEHVGAEMSSRVLERTSPVFASEIVSRPVSIIPAIDALEAVPVVRVSVPVIPVAEVRQAAEEGRSLFDRSGDALPDVCSDVSDEWTTPLPDQDGTDLSSEELSRGAMPRLWRRIAAAAERMVVDWE